MFRLFVGPTMLLQQFKKISSCRTYTILGLNCSIDKMFKDHIVKKKLKGDTSRLYQRKKEVEAGCFSLVCVSERYAYA